MNQDSSDVMRYESPVAFILSREASKFLEISTLATFLLCRKAMWDPTKMEVLHLKVTFEDICHSYSLQAQVLMILPEQMQMVVLQETRRSCPLLQRQKACQTDTNH